MRELIDTYYAYQQWANGRILETAAKVPFEQLTVPVLSGFDPVRSTLAHMMWAQQLWLHRFQGLPRVPDIEPADLPIWPHSERAGTRSTRRPMTSSQP